MLEIKVTQARRAAGMDYHHLRQINLQLETLIREKERERLRPGLTRLFEAGCGFTEFLVRLFHHLAWTDIENCRLVSSTWKNFIDRLPSSDNPDC